MKQQLIVATAVATLLAGTSIASAQRAQEGGPVPSAPPAAQSAPGSQSPGAPGASSERTGQGSAQNPGSRMKDAAEDKAAPKAVQGTTSPQNRAGDRAPPNRMGQDGTRTQAPDQAQRPSAQSPSGTQAQSPSAQQPVERNASGAASQTNVNVNLNTEQRTRIRQTVLKETSAPRISRNDVNFNISVGTVVPRTVRVATLPAAVIDIHPAWRGYSYILVGDEIVILEPNSLRIVAIIPA